ncbi:MAG: hypothetical protein NTY65_08265 [Planctomycetota bacterium]|nr:hypothetical protein [Planctomycetota bacterium]
MEPAAAPADLDPDTSAKEKGFHLVFIGRKPTGATVADVARTREILGLDPQAKEFRLVFGSVSSGDTELSILCARPATPDNQGDDRTLPAERA